MSRKNLNRGDWIIMQASPDLLDRIKVPRFTVISRKTRKKMPYWARGFSVHSEHKHRSHAQKIAKKLNKMYEVHES